MTHSETFLAAIEANDFRLAGCALHAYICWFQSAPRTLAEIAAAKDVIASGMRLTAHRKSRFTEDLMLLTRLAAAYCPVKTTHTWRVQG